MLYEIKNVRQIPGEDTRRWYVDENTDLIVWYGPKEDVITGFQLCFDKKSVQRCLTWQRNSNSGKSLLSADARYSRRRVIRLFDSISEELPEELSTLVRLVLTGDL
jgi:hypothetical protein